VTTNGLEISYDNTSTDETLSAGEARTTILQESGKGQNINLTA
jgi:hypothetical protein